MQHVDIRKVQLRLKVTSLLCGYVQSKKKKSLSVLYPMASGKSVPVQMLTRHRFDSISGVKFCSNDNYKVVQI